MFPLRVDFFCRSCATRETDAADGSTRSLRLLKGSAAFTRCSNPEAVDRSKKVGCAFLLHGRPLVSGLRRRCGSRGRWRVVHGCFLVTRPGSPHCSHPQPIRARMDTPSLSTTPLNSRGENAAQERSTRRRANEVELFILPALILRCRHAEAAQRQPSTASRRRRVEQMLALYSWSLWAGPRSAGRRKVGWQRSGSLDGIVEAGARSTTRPPDSIPPDRQEP